MCFLNQSMIDYLIRFAACRKSWTLDALSGRIVWTLGLWTPRRLDSERLDSGRLNAWTLNFGRLNAWTRDAWTLELGTPGRLDFGQ